MGLVIFGITFIGTLLAGVSMDACREAEAEPPAPKSRFDSAFEVNTVYKGVEHRQYSEGAVKLPGGMGWTCETGHVEGDGLLTQVLLCTLGEAKVAVTVICDRTGVDFDMAAVTLGQGPDHITVGLRCATVDTQAPDSNIGHSSKLPTQHI
jgi:hypothetical protein